MATWIGGVIQVVTLAAAAGVALYLAWKITLLLLLIVPLLYWLASRFGPKITRVSKIENEEEARLREMLASAIGAYMTVRIFALQEAVRERIRERMEGFLGVLYSRVRTAKTYQTVSNVCLSLAEATVLIAAGYGVVSGTLTIGGLFAYLSAFWKLIGAANGLIAQLPELAKLDGYVARLNEFESSAPAEEEDEGDFDAHRAGGGERRLQRARGPQGREPRHRRPGAGADRRAERQRQDHPRLRDDAVPQAEPRGGPGAVRWSGSAPSWPPSTSSPAASRTTSTTGTSTRRSGDSSGAWSTSSGCAETVDQDSTRELSEGQKKKAQIVMTLLKDADVYIYDEPLASVDAESKEKIVRRQLDRAKGGTLITIMHGDEQFHSHFERIVPLAQRPAVGPTPG